MIFYIHYCIHVYITPKRYLGNSVFCFFFFLSRKLIEIHKIFMLPCHVQRVVNHRQYKSWIIYDFVKLSLPAQSSDVHDSIYPTAYWLGMPFLSILALVWQQINGHRYTNLYFVFK